MPAKKYKVGLTFGVYDLFHIGHLNLLTKASLLCDKLVVCVSTDKYSEKKKNKTPIIPWKERAQIIAALRCVSIVDEQSMSFRKEDAIKKYSPDVLFVGDDWNDKTYGGAKLGVKVEYLPYTSHISTTEIRRKLGLML